MGTPFMKKSWEAELPSDDLKPPKSIAFRVASSLENGNYSLSITVLGKTRFFSLYNRSAPDTVARQQHELVYAEASGFSTIENTVLLAR
jgi:hypothetical protein